MRFAKDGRYKSCPDCVRAKETLDTDNLLEELEKSLHELEEEEKTLFTSPTKKTPGQVEAARLQAEKATKAAGGKPGASEVMEEKAGASGWNDIV